MIGLTSMRRNSAKKARQLESDEPPMEPGLLIEWRHHDVHNGANH